MTKVIAPVGPLLHAPARRVLTFRCTQVLCHLAEDIWQSLPKQEEQCDPRSRMHQTGFLAFGAGLDLIWSVVSFKQRLYSGCSSPSLAKCGRAVWLELALGSLGMSRCVLAAVSVAGDS